MEPLNSITHSSVFVTILTFGALAFNLLWTGFLVYAVMRGLRYGEVLATSAEEQTEMEKQRTVQMDEALTLLKVLNENLSNRTTKN